MPSLHIHERRVPAVLSFAFACGLALLATAGAARADYATAFRFAYDAPGAQGDVLLGPGAARGIKIIPNPPDGPGARGARPEGESFEILGVSLLAQNAKGCGNPDFKFNGVIDCTWEKDCVQPFDSIDLCIRSNLPIYYVTAYWVDEVGDFIAPAFITPLPGACGVLDCSGAVAAIESIWPPNNKLSPVAITGVTGVGEISIVATGITQDEPLNTRGDGESCPDGVIDVDGGAWVRMERSGLGNGRVYVVSFTATDATGATCDGEVTVCVPHDPATACVDDGQTVDATETCGDGSTQISLEVAGAAPALRVVSSTARHADLEFSLPAASRVDIGVFDVAGRRLATIENGQRAAGAHRVSWEAGALAQGVYFVRLRANGTALSKTLMIAD